MKRQRFYCFIYYAQIMDIHLSEKSAKLHDWPIMGSLLLVQWTTSYFLLYQDCHQFQQQFVFNIEINRSVIFPENWDYQIQSRLEVTSMHAGNRCWQIVTSRPRETVSRHAKHFSDEMYMEDPTQDGPDWIQLFTVNLEDLQRCARTFLWKSELRFGKWRFKSGDNKMEAQCSHSLLQIPKEISIPRTEEIGDMRTVEHKSESRKNHQFAVVVQDLAIQRIQSYPCKTKTSQETEKNFNRSFQSRRRSQKLFIWTIYENLANIVNN